MSVWASIQLEANGGVEAGEDLADGALLCIKDADGKAYKADSDDAALSPCIGAAGAGVSSGEYVQIVIMGRRNDGSSVKEGEPCYLSTTAAAMTQTAHSTTPQVVGYGLTSTDWIFFPMLAYSVPT